MEFFLFLPWLSENQEVYNIMKHTVQTRTVFVPGLQLNNDFFELS